METRQSAGERERDIFNVIFITSKIERIAKSCNFQSSFHSDRRMRVGMPSCTDDGHARNASRGVHTLRPRVRACTPTDARNNTPVACISDHAKRQRASKRVFYRPSLVATPPQLSLWRVLEFEMIVVRWIRKSFGAPINFYFILDLLNLTVAEIQKYKFYDVEVTV